MTADLTREQAREQVARAIWDSTNPLFAWEEAVQSSIWSRRALLNADAALTVLWPVVESLRAERDAAVLNVYRLASDRDVADAELAGLRFEIANLTADLAHAHAVIARHVEPLRKPCRPEAGDCCDGSAHTWQPAQGSRLPDCGPAAAPVGDQGSGRVETRGKEDHG